MSNLIIKRNKILLNKLVVINGQPGCGKTMLSSILSSFKNVEIMNYSTVLENIVRLNYLNKISTDAASSMIRSHLDELLYENMMSRNVNFRYSDLSSVFRNPKKFNYIKRLFIKGDELIPNIIKKEKPVLHLATHNLLKYSDILFKSYKDRIKFIEVVRHPLYMIKQQKINYDNFNKKKERTFHINIKKGNEEYQIQDPRLNKKLNINKKTSSIDLAIYSIKLYFDYVMEEKKHKFLQKKILFIPFEKLVKEPDVYLKKIEKYTHLKKTSLTKKIMRREKIPRNKYSDGINLDIYKKMGWKKPNKNFSEKDEFDLRLKWAKDNNISDKCYNLLKEISSKYENLFLK